MGGVSSAHLSCRRVDQNLTIGDARAGGVSDDGRCDECFRAGFGISELDCGASVTAGAPVTGAGAFGGGGAAIGGRPTTNPGVCSGVPCSTEWPSTERLANCLGA